MRLIVETLLVLAIAVPVVFPETRGLLPTWIWLGLLALLLGLRSSLALGGAECLPQAWPRPQNVRREGRCAGENRRGNRIATGS